MNAKVRRWYTALVAALAAIGLMVPPAGAAGYSVSMRANRTRVPASGGTVVLVASESGVRTCTWRSAPRIPNFARRVACKARMVRTAHIPANKSAGTRDFRFLMETTGPRGPRVAWKVVAEPSESPTRWEVIATGTASGQYSIASAAGNVNDPTRIRLVIRVSQSQNGLVTWDNWCTETNGDFRTADGQATVALPATVGVRVPGRPSSCSVSASVDMDVGGSATLLIEVAI